MSANKEELDKIFSTESNTSVLDEIDFRRVKYVLAKFSWLVLMLIVLSVGISYAIIRWTKPLYEAESIIKLDLKSQNDVLGGKFGGVSEDEVSELIGEIEIIKSNVIFQELIDSLDVDISYYEKGKILIDEHYKEACYSVLYRADSNQVILDTDIHVLINSAEGGSLSISNEIQAPFKFGEQVDINGFKLILFKTEKFSPEAQNRDFYFRVNSESYLVNYFKKGLKVEIENAKARTIRIAFESYDNKKAYDVIAQIVKIYQHRSLEVKRKVQEQTISFIENQLREAETNLNRAEINMEDFIISSGSLDPKQELFLVKEKLAGLETEKKDIKIQIELLNKVHTFVKNEQGTENGLPFVEGIINESLKAAILTLNEEYREFSLLKATTKSNTLAYKNKLIKIQGLKVDINENVFQSKSILEEQYLSLNEMIAQLDKEFLTLPAKETESNRLKRFYSLWESFYLFLVNKKVEFGIAKAGMTSEFIILKNPAIPHHPIKPEPTLILLSSVSVSVFLGLIVLVVGYIKSNTLFSSNDINKASNIPLLAEIPLYTSSKMKYSKLLVLDNPKSSISESFRSLRTNLTFLKEKNNESQIISITSTVGGEGKTFVATNLAGILAISGKKVILLDLDLRKPKVHYAFGHENDPIGISSILIGESGFTACVKDTSIASLKYINAGSTPPNPSELLLRNEFPDLLKGLKEEYDYVIIDTPPIGLVTDGFLVMKHSSVQLYVAKAKYSKLAVLKDIDQLYRSKRFSHLAMVLNGVSDLNSKYGYKAYGYYEES